MRILITHFIIVLFLYVLSVPPVSAQNLATTEEAVPEQQGAHHAMQAGGAAEHPAQGSQTQEYPSFEEYTAQMNSNTATETTMPVTPDPRPIIPVADPKENQSTYTLGKEDVIEIAVMRHPEVSGNYIINNEGKIQYGFIGDVVVEGSTKDQVKDAVTQLLNTYIVTPEVTVTIVGYNSKVIYVVGEVGAPGKIYMRGDTITVREALVQSGLPLLTAASKRSKVITPSESGNALQRDVDVDLLLYRGDLRENLVMAPGDTLYVPPTFLAKTMRAISPVTQPVGAAASTGRTVTTGF